MAIRLDDHRTEDFKAQLRTLFAEDFDEPLSDFRAQAVLELCLTTLGPAIYNQAVQDVRAHLQSKLDDLDIDLDVQIER